MKKHLLLLLILLAACQKNSDSCFEQVSLTRHYDAPAPDAIGFHVTNINPLDTIKTVEFIKANKLVESLYSFRKEQRETTQKIWVISTRFMHVNDSLEVISKLQKEQIRLITTKGDTILLKHCSKK